MKNVIKQIITTITIVVVIIVILANICVLSYLENHLGEKIDFIVFDIKNICIVIFFIITIILFSMLIRKTSKRVQQVLLCICLGIFFIVELMVVKNFIAKPRADQDQIMVRAQSMFNKTDGWIFEDSYMQAYPQQTTIVWIISLIFKVINSNNYKYILILNAIANIVTIIAIYKIIKLYGEKYELNTVIPMIIITTFIPLILLVIFFYGDFIATALAMMGIYFIMKYGTQKKWQNLLISSILISISYIFRKNNLIFILAVIIYLVIKALENKKTRNYLFIILFVIVTIFPQKCIEHYMAKKYSIDIQNAYPTAGFLYLGMSESSRAEGWYSEDTYKMAYEEDVDDASKMYMGLIKERLIYFKENPLYMIKFYARKICSMWAENTYGSVWYNIPLYLEVPEKIDEAINNSKLVNFIQDEKNENLINTYQKATLVLTMICVGVVAIQNLKRKDAEITLLFLVLLGGFWFHVLWEAKSRYIIPYIISVIPLTAIGYEEMSKKIKNQFSKKEERK